MVPQDGIGMTIVHQHLEKLHLVSNLPWRLHPSPLRMNPFLTIYSPTDVMRLIHVQAILSLLVRGAAQRAILRLTMAFTGPNLQKRIGVAIRWLIAWWKTVSTGHVRRPDPPHHPLSRLARRCLLAPLHHHSPANCPRRLQAPPNHPRPPCHPLSCPLQLQPKAVVICLSRSR